MHTIICYFSTAYLFAKIKRFAVFTVINISKEIFYWFSGSLHELSELFFYHVPEQLGCAREQLYSRYTREDTSDVDSNCFDLTNRRQSLSLQLLYFFRTVIKPSSPNMSVNLSSMFVMCFCQFYIISGFKMQRRSVVPKGGTVLSFSPLQLL